MKRLLLCMAMAGIHSVAASPLQQSISVEAGTEYDSNPAMTATNPQGVWVSTINPRYQVRWVEDRNEWTVAAEVNLQRSSDQSLRVDREDPSLEAGWTHSYVLGRITVTANYEKTSTSSTETDDPASGGSNDTRTRNAVRAEWEHAVSEVTTVGAELSHEMISYEGSGGGASGYTDYDTTTAMARIERLLSERNSVYAQVTNVHYSAGGGTSTNQHTGVVGVRSALTPAVNIDANIGVSHTDSGGGSNTPTGSVELTHAGERIRSSVAYNRSASASGSGGFSESETLTAAVVYEVDERTDVGASASIRRSLGEGDSTTSSSVELEATREIYEDISISAIYGYRQQNTATANAEGSVWGLSLSYDMPDL